MKHSASSASSPAGAVGSASSSKRASTTADVTASATSAGLVLRRAALAVTTWLGGVLTGSTGATREAVYPLRVGRIAVLGELHAGSPAPLGELHAGLIDST